jgi:hypothetical protein
MDMVQALSNVVDEMAASPHEGDVVRGSDAATIQGWTSF